MNDTISDLFVRILNARRAGRDDVNIPFSHVKQGILEVLREEGYIGDFSVMNEQKEFTIDLSGADKDFEKIRRVSRPGRRSYVKSKNIPKPKGYGIVILSTPQGILSGRKAKSAGIGGELICEVF